MRKRQTRPTRFIVYAVKTGGMASDPREVAKVDTLDDARYHATLSLELGRSVPHRTTLICDTHAKDDAERWFSVDSNRERAVASIGDENELVAVNKLDRLNEPPFKRPPKSVPPVDEYEAAERRENYGRAFLTDLQNRGFIQKHPHED